jgi:hypothetical protein
MQEFDLTIEYDREFIDRFDELICAFREELKKDEKENYQLHYNIPVVAQEDQYARWALYQGGKSSKGFTRIGIDLLNRMYLDLLLTKFKDIADEKIWIFNGSGKVFDFDRISSFSLLYPFSRDFINVAQISLRDICYPVMNIPCDIALEKFGMDVNCELEVVVDANKFTKFIQTSEKIPFKVKLGSLKSYIFIEQMLRKYTIGMYMCRNNYTDGIYEINDDNYCDGHCGFLNCDNSKKNTKLTTFNLRYFPKYINSLEHRARKRMIRDFEKPPKIINFNLLG